MAEEFPCGRGGMSDAVSTILASCRMKSRIIRNESMRNMFHVGNVMAKEEVCRAFLKVLSAYIQAHQPYASRPCQHGREKTV